MPILLNTWELDDSSNDDIYDDRMPWLLNRYELDYSSDYSSNNEDCSNKGLGYTGDLNEEYNFDGNSITYDENYNLIGWYKSDYLSTKGKDEVTVPVCDKIEKSEEENYTYGVILKILSEREKYFELVGTVTKPKDEHNYQVGKLENALWILEKVVIL